MDVKETILNQHKTLKRIEELQEFMHGTSMLALDLDKAGVIEQPEEKKIVFATMHVLSHVIEDVLNGKDVPDAMRDALYPDEDKD
jgi:hypothetical protein